MLNPSQQLKFFLSGALALALLMASFAFIPANQDPGIQGTVFNNVVVNATPQSVTVACGQGSGSIGRKTLVVWNGPSPSGTLTVIAELRDDLNSPDFTTGYLAVNALAINAVGSDTSLPTEAGGKYCRVTATSAVTSVITVTLRRE